MVVLLVKGAAALAPLSSFEAYVERRQSELCERWEALDGSGARFSVDRWERGDGSHGVARVLQGGALVEKGAVSTTFARGTLSKQRAEAARARGREGLEEGQPFRAAALSIVLHPRSPLVPTFRADVRAFAVAESVWFGGGADLTPCYVFDDDAREWHSLWRELCGDQRYRRFKTWCDDYFYLPLREEHRGIGGIFFDDLASIGGEQNVDPAEAFVRRVADAFDAAWRPVVDRRRNMPYGDRERQWQLERRGRYLEFNLLSDRGVRFGLSPDAIDRVMVSAPPLVAWTYGQPDPDPASDEGRLLAVLRNPPRDWISSS